MNDTDLKTLTEIGDRMVKSPLPPLPHDWAYQTGRNGHDPQEVQMQIDTFGWKVAPKPQPIVPRTNSWAEQPLTAKPHDYEARLTRIKADGEFYSVVALLLGFAVGYWLGGGLDKKLSDLIPGGTTKGNQ